MSQLRISGGGHPEAKEGVLICELKSAKVIMNGCLRGLCTVLARVCVPGRYLYHLDKFAFKNKLRRGDHAGVDEFSGFPHFKDKLCMLIKLH